MKGYRTSLLSNQPLKWGISFHKALKTVLVRKIVVYSVLYQTMNKKVSWQELVGIPSECEDEPISPVFHKNKGVLIQKPTNVNDSESSNVADSGCLVVYPQDGTRVDEVQHQHNSGSVGEEKKSCYDTSHSHLKSIDEDKHHLTPRRRRVSVKRKLIDHPLIGSNTPKRDQIRKKSKNLDSLTTTNDNPSSSILDKVVEESKTNVQSVRQSCGHKQHFQSLHDSTFNDVSGSKRKLLYSCNNNLTGNIKDSKSVSIGNFYKSILLMEEADNMLPKKGSKLPQFHDLLSKAIKEEFVCVSDLRNRRCSRLESAKTDSEVIFKTRHESPPEELSPPHAQTNSVDDSFSNFPFTEVENCYKQSVQPYSDRSKSFEESTSLTNLNSVSFSINNENLVPENLCSNIVQSLPCRNNVESHDISKNDSFINCEDSFSSGASHLQLCNEKRNSPDLDCTFLDDEMKDTNKFDEILTEEDMFSHNSPQNILESPSKSDSLFDCESPINILASQDDDNSPIKQILSLSTPNFLSKMSENMLLLESNSTIDGNKTHVNNQSTPGFETTPLNSKSVVMKKVKDNLKRLLTQSSQKTCQTDISSDNLCFETKNPPPAGCNFSFSSNVNDSEQNIETLLSNVVDKKSSQLPIQEYLSEDFSASQTTVAQFSTAGGSVVKASQASINKARELMESVILDPDRPEPSASPSIVISTENMSRAKALLPETNQNVSHNSSNIIKTELKNVTTHSSINNIRLLDSNVDVISNANNLIDQDLLTKILKEAIDNDSENPTCLKRPQQEVMVSGRKFKVTPVLKMMSPQTEKKPEVEAKLKSESIRAKAETIENTFTKSPNFCKTKCEKTDEISPSNSPKFTDPNDYKISYERNLPDQGHLNKMNGSQISVIGHKVKIDTTKLVPKMLNVNGKKYRITPVLKPKAAANTENVCDVESKLKTETLGINTPPTSKPSFHGPSLGASNSNSYRAKSLYKDILQECTGLEEITLPIIKQNTDIKSVDNNALHQAEILNHFKNIKCGAPENLQQTKLINGSRNLNNMKSMNERINYDSVDVEQIKNDQFSNTDILLEAPSNVKQNSFAFSTASGRKVSISEDHLQKARSLIHEDSLFEKGKEENINLPEIGECRNASIIDVKNPPTITKLTSFSTASGSKVPISEDHLLKARMLMQEGSLFENGKEENINLAEVGESRNASIIDVKKPPINPELKSFAFSTASGSKVSISEDHLQKARMLLQEDSQIKKGNEENINLAEVRECRNASIIHAKKPPINAELKSFAFSTASGSKVSISEEHLQKARSLMHEDSLFEKGKEENINLAEVGESRNASIIDAKKPPINAKLKAFAFSTASGSKVSISEENLQKARSLMHEDSLFEKGKEENINLAEVGESRNASIIDAKKPPINAKLKAFAFSTASGSKVSISEDHLQKARSLMHEDSQFEKGKEENINLAGVGESRNASIIDSKKPPINAELKSFSFSTASGSKVSISEEHLQKARSLMHEDSLFEKGKEENINLTEVEECRNASVIDVEKPPTNTELKSFAFSTASGSKVPISEDHLQKVRLLMKEDSLFEGVIEKDISSFEEKPFQNIQFKTAFRAPLKSRNVKGESFEFSAASSRNALVSDEHLLKAGSHLQYNLFEKGNEESFDFSSFGDESILITKNKHNEVVQTNSSQKPIVDASGKYMTQNKYNGSHILSQNSSLFEALNITSCEMDHSSGSKCDLSNRNKVAIEIDEFQSTTERDNERNGPMSQAPISSLNQNDLSNIDNDFIGECTLRHMLQDSNFDYIKKNGEYISDNTEIGKKEEENVKDVLKTKTEREIEQVGGRLKLGNSNTRGSCTNASRDLQIQGTPKATKENQPKKQPILVLSNANGRKIIVSKDSLKQVMQRFKNELELAPVDDNADDLAQIEFKLSNSNSPIAEISGLNLEDISHSQVPDLKKKSKSILPITHQEEINISNELLKKAENIIQGQFKPIKNENSSNLCTERPILFLQTARGDKVNISDDRLQNAKLGFKDIFDNNEGLSVNINQLNSNNNSDYVKENASESKKCNNSRGILNYTNPVKKECFQSLSDSDNSLNSEKEQSSNMIQADGSETADKSPKPAKTTSNRTFTISDESIKQLLEETLGEYDPSNPTMVAKFAEMTAQIKNVISQSTNRTIPSNDSRNNLAKNRESIKNNNKPEELVAPIQSKNETKATCSITEENKSEVSVDHLGSEQEREELKPSTSAKHTQNILMSSIANKSSPTALQSSNISFTKEKCREVNQECILNKPNLVPNEIDSVYSKCNHTDSGDTLKLIKEQCTDASYSNAEKLSISEPQKQSKDMCLGNKSTCENQYIKKHIKGSLDSTLSTACDKRRRNKKISKKKVCLNEEKDKSTDSPPVISSPATPDTQSQSGYTSKYMTGKFQYRPGMCIEFLARDILEDRMGSKYNPDNHKMNLAFREILTDLRKAYPPRLQDNFENKLKADSVLLKPKKVEPVNRNDAKSAHRKSPLRIAATQCGKIGVSECNLKRAQQLFKNEPELCSSFCTALGKSVSFSEESLKEVRQKFKDELALGGFPVESSCIKKPLQRKASSKDQSVLVKDKIGLCLGTRQGQFNEAAKENMSPAVNDRPNTSNKNKVKHKIGLNKGSEDGVIMDRVKAALESKVGKFDPRNPKMIQALKVITAEVKCALLEPDANVLLQTAGSDELLLLAENKSEAYGSSTENRSYQNALPMRVGGSKVNDISDARSKKPHHRGSIGNKSSKPHEKNKSQITNPGFSFSTASGGKVGVSEESLRTVKQQLSDDFPTLPKDKLIGGPTVQPNVNNSFSSCHECKITISEESSRKINQQCEDDLEIKNPRSILKPVHCRPDLSTPTASAEKKPASESSEQLSDMFTKCKRVSDSDNKGASRYSIINENRKMTNDIDTDVISVPDDHTNQETRENLDNTISDDLLETIAYEELPNKIIPVNQASLEWAVKKVLVEMNYDYDPNVPDSYAAFKQIIAEVKAMISLDRLNKCTNKMVDTLLNEQLLLENKSNVTEEISGRSCANQILSKMQPNSTACEEPVTVSKNNIIDEMSFTQSLAEPLINDEMNRIEDSLINSNHSATNNIITKRNTVEESKLSNGNDCDSFSNPEDVLMSEVADSANALMEDSETFSGLPLVTSPSNFFNRRQLQSAYCWSPPDMSDDEIFSAAETPDKGKYSKNSSGQYCSKRKSGLESPLQQPISKRVKIFTNRLEDMPNVGEITDARKKYREIQKQRSFSQSTISDGLYMSIRSQKALTTFMDSPVNNLQTYTHEELLELGLSEEAINVTSKNACDFKFNACDFFTLEECYSDQGYIDLEDGFKVVLSDENTIGLEEITDCFLSHPSVDPTLVPKDWIKNHFRWIIWKLSSLERSFPKIFAKRFLVPVNILHQLKYRYDREIDRTQRPALRRILECDMPASRRFIACVADIRKVEIEGLESSSVELELTDGWYSVWSTIDSAMEELIKENKVKIGTKLIVHGAELVDCADGCDPLELKVSLRLKLHTNSTRRVRWLARMGFTQYPGPIAVSLDSILPNGGVIGLTSAVVARVYPMLYMSKGENGKSVIRNAQAQNQIFTTLDKERNLKTEELYERVSREVEARYKAQKGPVKLDWKNIKQVTDPELLWRLFSSESDTSELQSLLTPEQLDQLKKYHEKISAKVREEVNKTLSERLDELLPRQKVVELMKIRLADPLTETTALVTIYRPDEDIFGLLTEGRCVDFYNLNAWGLRDKIIQLANTKQTKYKENLSFTQTTKFQRKLTDISDLYHRDNVSMFGELDVVGVVILVKEPEKPWGVTNVYITDTKGNFLLIILWSSLKVFGCEDILKVGSVVAAINLQRRLGSGSYSVPSSFANEFTYFSQKPSYAHLKEGIQEINTFLAGKDIGSFVASRKELLASYLKDRSLNTTPVRSRESAVSKKLELLKNYSPATPLPKVPLGSSPDVHKKFKSPKMAGSFHGEGLTK